MMKNAAAFLDLQVLDIFSEGNYFGCVRFLGEFRLQAPSRLLFNSKA